MTKYYSFGLTIGWLAWTTCTQAEEPIVFEDVTGSSGLSGYLETDSEHRAWRYAHGAGWGDVDGDGRPDLYIGAFAARRGWYNPPGEPLPNMLLLNKPASFQLAVEENLQFKQRNARCSGVLFADLDNDGDLDLVVANHTQRIGQDGSRLFEGHGDGTFRDVTPMHESWPGQLGVRNVTAIDVDQDGLLDLIMADGSYGRTSAAKLHVLRNGGAFRFEEISAKLNLPQTGTPGLGLAVGDINQDGRPDLFVAGSNRLFVTDGKGKFQEAHPGRFANPPADQREGLHCGAAFGDLDGDDLLDLVTTEHGVPTRIHVYLNRGIQAGIPELVESSTAAGFGQLFPRGSRELPIKTAHVALQDLDHDGRVDIVLSVIHRDAQGRVQPVVLRNLGRQPGELRFSVPPYDQMIGYYAPAPLADFDRDGRLDIFMASWFESLPNYLFRNVTKTGNWLAVSIRGEAQDLNTMGIGAVVRIYRAGHMGDLDHLLRRSDVVVGTGYAGTEEAIVHAGLGSAQSCDVEIRWGDYRKALSNLPANQYIKVVVADD